MANKFKTLADVEKHNQKIMKEYVEKHKGVPERPIPKNAVGTRAPGTPVKKPTTKKK